MPLTNIDQQKLLYGDEQVRKEVLSSKNQGRNTSAQNSQQMKKNSVKNEKLLNKESILNKKRNLKQKWDQAMTLPFKQNKFFYQSGTMTNETPPPMDQLV